MLCADITVTHCTGGSYRTLYYLLASRGEFVGRKHCGSTYADGGFQNILNSVCGYTLCRKSGISYAGFTVKQTDKKVLASDIGMTEIFSRFNSVV